MASQLRVQLPSQGLGGKTSPTHDGSDGTPKIVLRYQWDRRLKDVSDILFQQRLLPYRWAKSV